MDEEAILHALLKSGAEAVLGESKASVVGNDVLLDRSDRRTGAVLEGLDSGRSQSEVGLICKECVLIRDVKRNRGCGNVIQIYSQA